jgi:hypothetical protein
MKKPVVLLLLFVVFSGCDKEYKTSNLQFIETTPGGCAVDKSESLKNALIEKDNVTFSVSGDELNILVGFNASCCSKFSTSSAIKGDSILIDIKTAELGPCNCICYYTYNFKFSGFTSPFCYKVLKDNLTAFSGRIKP